MKWNPQHRSFGYPSRYMDWAMAAAIKDSGASFKTVATYKSHCRHFAKFMRSEFGVVAANRVERRHVEMYAAYLKHGYEAEHISLSTAHNYLAAVNRGLSLLRRDEQCRVRAVKDAGFKRRESAASTDKSASLDLHLQVIQHVDGRLGHLIKLQRYFGLRIKESMLLDCRKALKQAQSEGRIKVVRGTKGGQKRLVECTGSDQKKVLAKAVKLQGKARNLIPEDMTLAEYRSRCYEQIRERDYHFHQERHGYANHLYEKAAGMPSPVQFNSQGKERLAQVAKTTGISLQELKRRDKAARERVSKALGHHRESISSAYTGKD